MIADTGRLQQDKRKADQVSHDVPPGQDPWQLELLRAQSEFGRHAARTAREGSTSLRSLSANERGYSAWLRRQACALAQHARQLRRGASPHLRPKR